MEIPDRTMREIQSYACDHIPTGDFLRAVLENNLRESFGRADEENRAALFGIVAYVYNYLPSICWGSPERVRKWLAKKPVEEVK